MNAVGSSSATCSATCEGSKANAPCLIMSAEGHWLALFIAKTWLRLFGRSNWLHSFKVYVFDFASLGPRNYESDLSK